MSHGPRTNDVLGALNRHKKLQKTRDFVLTLALSQITLAVRQPRILLEEVRKTINEDR